MKKKNVIIISIVAGVVVLCLVLGGIFLNAITRSIFSLDGMNNEMIFPESKYIQKIDITGEIMAESFYSGYDHEGYLNLIDELMYDENNTGIYLYIDSPGGEAYTSDIMYQKLMEYREVTNRPIYAYVGSMCASGGYYIACAANKIYSGRSSWIGSIGCYVQMVDISELEKKIGIDTFLIKSGENKGAGALGEKVTKSQMKVYQDLIDDAYEIFLDVVKDGRNMSDEYARGLADGSVYTAKKSLKTKLIDGIMQQGEFEDLLKDELKTEEIFEAEIEPDFWTSFFAKANPKSELSTLIEILDKQKKEVLMYYVQ